MINALCHLYCSGENTVQCASAASDVKGTSCPQSSERRGEERSSVLLLHDGGLLFPTEDLLLSPRWDHWGMSAAAAAHLIRPEKVSIIIFPSLWWIYGASTCCCFFIYFLPDVICSTNVTQIVWCIARDSVRDHPSRLICWLSKLFPTYRLVSFPQCSVSQRLSRLHRPVEGRRGRGKRFFLRSRWSHDATWWPALLLQVWGTKLPPVMYTLSVGYEVFW